MELPKEMIFRYQMRGKYTTMNNSPFSSGSAKPLTNYAWISDDSEGSTKDCILIQPMGIFGHIRQCRMVPRWIWCSTK